MYKSYGYISNSFSRSSYILWSSIAVLAGGFIYIFFRSTEADFLNWFSSVGMENWLAVAREKSLSLTHVLPRWFVYSLPNGLWAFAYTLIILIIWKGSSSYVRYFWHLSIPVLVFGFELLQLTGNLPGTFCPYDLTWGAMGITVGSLTIYRKNYNLNLIR